MDCANKDDRRPLTGHASEDDVRRIRLANIESGQLYAQKLAAGTEKPFRHIDYGIGGGIRSSRQQRRVRSRAN